MNATEYKRDPFSDKIEPIKTMAERAQEYMNRPCTIVPDYKLWTVGGAYKDDSGGGVIAWCTSKKDAIEARGVLRLYGKHKDFTIGPYLPFLRRMKARLQASKFFRWNLDMDGDLTFTVAGVLHFTKYKHSTIIRFGTKVVDCEAPKYLGTRDYYNGPM